MRVEDRGRDRQQRVEPAARLVDSLADVVDREIRLEFAVLLEGIMPLREAGTARVEPAIHHERLARHLAVALAASQFHGVNVGAVQIFGNGSRVNRQFMQFGARANAVLVAALAAPDGERRAPEPFAADGPVLDVFEPFAESLLAHPRRRPLHLRIVRQQLLPHGSHTHEPRIHGVVEQWMVGTPAVGVVVRVFLGAVEYPRLAQQRDDIAVALLDVAAVKAGMHPGDEATIGADGVHLRQPDGTAQFEIFLAIHHRRMHDAGAGLGGDEVSGNYGPRRFRATGVNRAGEERLVAPPDKIGAGEFCQHLDLVPQCILQQLLGQNQLFAHFGAAISFPAGRWLGNTYTTVGNFLADSQPDVTRQCPRGRGPRQD